MVHALLFFFVRTSKLCSCHADTYCALNLFLTFEQKPAWCLSKILLIKIRSVDSFCVRTIMAQYVLFLAGNLLADLYVN